MNSPILTVLISAYNAENFIEEALNGILSQTFSDFEILIADDKSIDQTRVIIDKFNDPRIHRYHNNENKGKVHTINNILKYAKGKYFTVHDADDISVKTRFEKQINFLEGHIDYAMCGTNYIEVDSRGRKIVESKLMTAYEDIIKLKGIVESNQFHGPTLIIRKDILEDVGGFYRDKFYVAEDVEFCLRVLEKYKCCNLVEHLYVYRWVSNSLTKSFKHYKPEYFAIKDLLYYLINERKVYGVDSYMRNDKDHIDKVYSEYVIQWIDRWDEIYKTGIDRMVYFKLWKNALLLNIKWINHTPLKLTPYKYLVTLGWNYLFKRNFAN